MRGFKIFFFLGKLCLHTSQCVFSVCRKRASIVFKLITDTPFIECFSFDNAVEKRLVAFLVDRMGSVLLFFVKFIDLCILI